MTKEEYTNFKKELVIRFYNLFPIYLIPADINNIAKEHGVDFTGKREQAITALNNMFFKIREGRKNEEKKHKR